MSVYTKLADHIDNVFHEGLGPYDENRPFVCIFRNLLTEREAALMCCLNESNMSCDEAAERAGTERKEMAQILRHLRDLGMIYEQKGDPEVQYRLMPFIPGIFESILKDVTDLEIARLQDLFIEELHQRRHEKVIPVNQVIRTEVREASGSEIEACLDAADRYALMDCTMSSIRLKGVKVCSCAIAVPAAVCS